MGSDRSLTRLGSTCQAWERASRPGAPKAGSMDLGARCFVFFPQLVELP
jgi:hypothetical protein